MMLQEMALYTTVSARNSNKIITKGENTDNTAIVVTSVPDTQIVQNIHSWFGQEKFISGTRCLHVSQKRC